MKLYTWKDIERHFCLTQEKWRNVINSVEVYPTDIILYIPENHQKDCSQTVQELFGNNYLKESNHIKLDIGCDEIPISICISEDDELGSKPIRPLFSSVLYQKSAYPSIDLEKLSHPVIAFHSYKGGVGRSLSLLAFAKAWSSVFEEKKNSRLLIVDADIEAPGLTWIQSTISNETFSYLDLLTMIQDNRPIDEIAELACSKLKMSTITVETDTQKIEHIFMPTYRYEEQLIDLYATPESIVNIRKREYSLATIFSKICDRLGLSVALVDLRAGISEYSSTILLDPRVKKYLVTSTSTQSIRGTQTILKYLLKGLSVGENTNIPEIFLNMVPDTLSLTEKEEIVEELTKYYVQENEGGNFTDNVVVELPFASELIHLTSVSQIMMNLDGRSLYVKLKELVEQNYYEESHEHRKDISNRNELLSKINQLASEQLTAEGNGDFDVLMTTPIKYLAKRYSDIIPAAVVMGAKGAGKTFLYRKMTEAIEWKTFCEKLGGSFEINIEAEFLPVIATKNVTGILSTIKTCVRKTNENISCANADVTGFLDNSKKLEQAKNHETDWFAFWETLLVKTINPKWNSFEEANKNLEICQKKIVFLIDGLEDVLTMVSQNEKEQEAVKILCQDIVAQLMAKYSNLGIIIFVRKDMVQSSIKVNFKQFEQTNSQAELRWSSSDALRLVLWLVSKAEKGFYKGKVEIENASQKVIDDNLIPLWGAKLGKPSSNEAYSSRWILAALSDFNGQLQARDIIRFLKYASVEPKKVPYKDRIIMPTEIRFAVSTCSKEKIEEVKQEYSVLKPILEKLEKLPTDQKKLPLAVEHARLSNEEEKHMIQEGYLKREGDKYYLPEIIRHALEFKYERGARPRVLAWTLK